MKKEKEFTMGKTEIEKGVTMEYNCEIVFSQEFNRKANWYSKNYGKEIGGFIIGSVTDGIAYCEDIIFPKQWVSGGEVDFKDGAVGMMRKEYGEEKIAKIIGEWHSHVKMGCFWSTTDLNDLIGLFMQDFDFGVFVVSSNGTHLVRAETSKPWTTILDNLDYSIEEPEEVEKEETQITLENELNVLIAKINDFKKGKELVVETEMMQVVKDKCEEKTYPKVKKGTWSNIKNIGNRDIYDDEYWDNLADNYNQNINNTTLSNDINYQIYDIVSSDKQDLSIKLQNLNGEWKDEVEQTLDAKCIQAGDYSLFTEIICQDKAEFKEKKKEVKGLVKMLLEEAQQ